MASDKHPTAVAEPSPSITNNPFDGKRHSSYHTGDRSTTPEFEWLPHELKPYAGEEHVITNPHEYYDEPRNVAGHVEKRKDRRTVALSPPGWKSVCGGSQNSRGGGNNGNEDGNGSRGSGSGDGNGRDRGGGGGGDDGREGNGREGDEREAVATNIMPPEDVFQDQLRQLNDMGFFDFDKNVEGLRKAKGNVQTTVRILLNCQSFN